MKRRLKQKLTVWQLLVIGFLVIVLVGALLLTLPCATESGETTPFVDALFTATSATCVTGLVVYDTAVHWSLMGELVILTMIQIGGLGFMTLITFIMRLIGLTPGLYTRETLLRATGGDNFQNVLPLLKRVLTGTLLFEFLGAALLSVRFISDFGVGRGIYMSVWHSISAFCNAGFDIMGSESAQFVSLTNYATDSLVVLVISALIIIGGLGFCVWSDLVDNGFRWHRLRLHTKVALTVTLLFLVLSTVLFFAFESGNSALEGMSVGEKLLVAFFNATTPRTAGFNIIPMESLSSAGFLLTLLLMFVGGNSGSTAGGIKLTTFAVIIMGMVSTFRGKRDINIGRRRITEDTVHQALTITVSCFALVFVGAVIICAAEPATVTPNQVVFETVSAMGTVGLSLGLTPVLSCVSKIVLMCLMFAGRVGILTLALALMENKEVNDVRNPVENILIG